MDQANFVQLIESHFAPGTFEPQADDMRYMGALNQLTACFPAARWSRLNFGVAITQTELAHFVAWAFEESYHTRSALARIIDKLRGRDRMHNVRISGSAAMKIGTALLKHLQVETARRDREVIADNIRALLGVELDDQGVFRLIDCGLLEQFPRVVLAPSGVNYEHWLNARDDLGNLKMFIADSLGVFKESTE